MKHFISSVKLISLVLLLLSASSSYAALGVTSVSPTQNNVSVAASTTISVTFDADIDQATLTAASVIVYGSISGKHTGTISFTGTSIVNFDPDNDFIAGEIVTVILTSDIESDAADPLTNGYEWNFTIGTASTAGTLEYYESKTIEHNTRNIATGDIDGDGDIDLITSGVNCSIFTNSGEGTFTKTGTIQESQHSQFVELLDVNADGILDVISVVGTSVYIYLGNGSGEFTFNNGISLPNSGSDNERHEMTMSDFNQDGLIDLAISNISTSNVSICLNNGDATFSLLNSYTVGSTPRSIVSGDFNGDGYSDIAVNDYSLDNLYILQNDGTAAFTLSSPMATLPYTSLGIKAADLDSDGDLDVLLVYNETTYMSIFSNNGDGTFAARVDVENNGEAANCSLNDIDGDGDLDLLTPFTNSTQVSVRKNNGSGTFGTATYLPAGTLANNLVVCDFDSDNDLDLVVINLTSLTLDIHMNSSSIKPEPTIQASNLSITHPSTSMDISFTKGNGFRRIVLAKQGSPVDAVPVDETVYTANTAFGSGDEIGSGNYVVYNGTGNSFSVSAIYPAYVYHFSVFEYNGGIVGAPTNYLTSSSLSGHDYKVFGSFYTTAGSALKFDGTNDGVDLGSYNLFKPDTAITIEAWIKPTSQTQYAQIVGNLWDNVSDESGYGLTLDGTSGIYFAIETASSIGEAFDYFSSGANTIPLNEWTHVAATYDGTTRRIYINGNEVQSSTSQSGNIVYPFPNNVRVGQYHDDDEDYYYQGEIDEVRLWAVARTTEEIREDMHNTVDEGSTNGMIGYWQFNDGSGTILVDQMGDNKGTLQNFQFDSNDGWVDSGVPIGYGSASSTEAFTSGTFNSENVSLTTTDSFDSAIDLTGTVINTLPNTPPTGSQVVLEDYYWVINSFGTPGTFTTNLTFTVPQFFSSAGNNSPNNYRLYNRASNSHGAWTEVLDHATSVSENSIQFDNVTSLGQFAIGRSNKIELDTIPGYVLKFDGTDDYMEVDDSPHFDVSAMTIELWFKWGASGETVQFLVGKELGQMEIHLGLGSNGLRFIPTSGVYLDTNPDAFTPGEWVHLACVYDPSQSLGKIYINGVDMNAVHSGSPLSTAITTSSASFNLGRRSNSSLYYLGEMDEVRLWKIARTESQIRSARHIISPSDTTGLVGYWQFNDASGSSVNENISNLDGTLSNFNNNSSSGWFTSTVPAGSGTVALVQAFTSGTANLDNISLTTTDDFDAAVNLQLTTINNTPNLFPDGFTEVVGTKYFVMNIFGSPGTYSTNITITFGPGVLDSRGDANPSGVKLYKRSDNSDGAWTLFGSATSVNSTTGVVVFNGLSSFSQLAVIEDDALLPVELVSFEGFNTEEGVLLIWQTATETNNYGFEIQKSEDRSQNSEESWVTVGFVQGHGTTNSPKNYEFTNSELPDVDEVSYRLKQIDNDGTFAYSKTITVDLTTLTSVEDEVIYEFALEQNYPNPFNPSTTIKFTVPNAGDEYIRPLQTKLIVYDILGREVATLVNQKLQPGNHEVQFDGSKLSSGMYFYRISVGNEFNSVRKMMLVK